MANQRVTLRGAPLGAELSPVASRVSVKVGVQPGGEIAIDLAWDDGPPTVVSAATNVAGDTLTVVFSEPLDEESLPLVTDFVLAGSVLGDLDTLDDITSATVTFSLTGTILGSETLTLDYTAPATGPLQDVWGNNVATFADQAVTNNVPL